MKSPSGIRPTRRVATGRTNISSSGVSGLIRARLRSSASLCLWTCSRMSAMKAGSSMRVYALTSVEIALTPRSTISSSRSRSAATIRMTAGGASAATLTL